MDAKIKIQVFGKKDHPMPIKSCNCSKKKNSSSGCSKCSGHKCASAVSNSSCCSNSNNKTCETMEEGFYEFKNSLLSSDIKNNIVVEFIDIESLEFQSNYTRVHELIDKGFDLPIIVIDQIIRYYGGISAMLVYKDVKELIEL
ncbi:hypothetical protein [Clostridium sp. DJ247]|uniref:hypothetical protein n=1 Tax=Clostridium sp. DJ247 TaxID=2726188 RepID=UPI001627361B|nr:hypothetical protein [Clostridium sp. DJ247]MBC2581002.1 hypothetical protein [Clostridium sp. DJ247]